MKRPPLGEPIVVGLRMIGIRCSRQLVSVVSSTRAIWMPLRHQTASCGDSPGADSILGDAMTGADQTACHLGVGPPFIASSDQEIAVASFLASTRRQSLAVSLPVAEQRHPRIREARPAVHLAGFDRNPWSAWLAVLLPCWSASHPINWPRVGTVVGALLHLAAGAWQERCQAQTGMQKQKTSQWRGRSRHLVLPPVGDVHRSRRDLLFSARRSSSSARMAA